MTSLSMIASLIGHITSHHLNLPANNMASSDAVKRQQVCNVLLARLGLPVNLLLSVKRADGSNQLVPPRLQRL